MSAHDVNDDEFLVARFYAGALPLALDAAHLTLLHDDALDAIDPLPSLGVARPASAETLRCGRFHFDGRHTSLRLGRGVQLVTVRRAQLFALPPLLEDLDRRGVLGILHCGDACVALLDARLLCAAR